MMTMMGLLVGRILLERLQGARGNYQSGELVPASVQRLSVH